MPAFGSAMGMSPELRASIQARSGQQNPQGSQISSGTPTGPGTVPPQVGNMPPSPPQTPGTQGQEIPNSPTLPPDEAILIIKALGQRLSSISKQQEPPKPPQMGGMR